MFREVTMIELKEVLRLWGKGLPKKRIAAQLGLSPKTVRRYLHAATAAGLRMDEEIRDEQVRDVLLALHPVGGRPRGDDWAVCATHREAIRRWLDGHIRLTKIRKLLAIRAQSAVDRFTSNAYDLVIEGDSYRPRFKPHLTTAAAKPSGKERSR